MGALLDRYGRWIAWALVALYVVLGAIGLTLQGVTSTSYTDMGVPILSLSIILVGVWPVTGALIVSHHPRHPVGWLLFLVAMSGATDMFAAGYIAYDTYARPLPGAAAALVWLTWGGFPVALMGFALLLLLFPAGHLPASRWRPLAWASVGALLLYIPLQALAPGPADSYFLPFLENPLGVSPSLWRILNPVRWLALGALVACFAAAIASLYFRLRRARGDERQQIKWLVYPATLFLVATPFIILGLAVPISSAPMLAAGIVLGMLGIFGIVAATAFAILKYRLYDIDLIINRTLVYGLLTLSLALIYFASVVTLQQILLAVTGQQSPLAIVLSTLFIAALFTPLRRRIQGFIDRRFYRRKYDAARTLAAFAATARDEVDLERLTAELLRVVDETMQPAGLSLWLKER